ncbi:MAG: hypothetical protein QOE99_3260 [Actinomycetota bacterium]|nr:hypothetical protein [Actinomycetota bacterium]
MPATQVAPKLLSWASDIEQGTIEQAARTARLPFVEGHVALMPDAHQGLGSTVGSVVPTRGAVIPSCVGVDIGCGMVASETTLTAADLPDSLDALMPLVMRRIPSGVGKGHQNPVAEGELASLGRPRTELTGKQERTVAEQFGTLGSGNHFLEVCLDERDVVWTVLHSGSRGIGNQLAQKAISEAKGLMKERFIRLEDPDLAYLVQGEPSFDSYIADMLWAQRYAMGSRAVMMDAALKSLFEVVGIGTEVDRINCFAGETPVITRTGTRPIEALAGGEHELLTTDGEWVKAPVQSFGRQEVWEVVLSRSGVVKTIRATREHGWLLRTRRNFQVEATTADLKPGDRMQCAFPTRPEGMAVDRLAAARGFVFGDGSVSSSNRSRACFCGDKDVAMLPLFEGLGRPARTYGTVTVVNGLPRDWKVERPSLDSDASVLYGWLAGYFAADGDVGKTGRPTLSSASRDNLEYVRLLCQTIGVGTFGIRSSLRKGYGKEPSALHLVGLMRGDLDEDFFLIPQHRARFVAGRSASERRGWNVVSVRPTGETTEVYCAVVEGTHTFALEDNILSRNCHHNFTQLEHHMGKDLWITRKGAIKAAAGDEGVIPGSMGTRSYVVSGLGATASYASCSHGAGRRMSRTAARKQLTVESLREAMAGRSWNDASAQALLDEHPASYKDIDKVMADQADLVEVQHTLRQVFNYKGV